MRSPAEAGVALGGDVAGTKALKAGPYATLSAIVDGAAVTYSVIALATGSSRNRVGRCSLLGRC